MVTFSYSVMAGSEDDELLDDLPLRTEPEVGEKLREVLYKRSDVLQAVANEALTKPELIDIVEMSRSTIDRSIRDLESLACVEKQHGCYVATTKGKFAIAEYNTYKNNSKSIDKAGSVLNYLSSDISISRDFLQDMTIHTRNSHVPDAVLKHSNELLRSTTHLIGLAPTALTSYPTLINDEVERRDMSAELVIEQSVFDSLFEVKRDAISDMKNHSEIKLYVSEGSLPYSLWVMEQTDGTTAGITVHDNGGVQGILTNNSTEAVTWAKEVYEKHRHMATPLDQTI